MNRNVEDEAAAGAAARDVTGSVWRYNIFGPQTIAGLGQVGHNADNRAV